jgi:hypothetical protein
MAWREALSRENAKSRNINWGFNCIRSTKLNEKVRALTRSKETPPDIAYTYV